MFRPMLRIRSRKEGFRRCGVAHSTDWVEYPADRFTAEEIEQLQTESMLQVEIAPDADEEAPGKGKGKGKE